MTEVFFATLSRLSHVWKYPVWSSSMSGNEGHLFLIFSLKSEMMSWIKQAWGYERLSNNMYYWISKTLKKLTVHRCSHSCIYLGIHSLDKYLLRPWVGCWDCKYCTNQQEEIIMKVLCSDFQGQFNTNMLALHKHKHILQTSALTQLNHTRHGTRWWAHLGSSKVLLSGTLPKKINHSLWF